MGESSTISAVPQLPTFAALGSGRNVNRYRIVDTGDITHALEQ